MVGAGCEGIAGLGAGDDLAAAVHDEQEQDQRPHGAEQHRQKWECGDLQLVAGTSQLDRSSQSHIQPVAIDSISPPAISVQATTQLETIMKTLNQKTRALSLFVLCLALAGGGAAFAEKKLASKGQPVIKVVLAGDTERDPKRMLTSR